LSEILLGAGSSPTRANSIEIAERASGLDEVELWEEFFDTLLNFDVSSQAAVNSWPQALRRRISKMEAHTSGRADELGSLLKEQAERIASQYRETGGWNA